MELALVSTRIMYGINLHHCYMWLPTQPSALMVDRSSTLLSVSTINNAAKDDSINQQLFKMVNLLQQAIKGQVAQVDQLQEKATFL